jgi:large subunit ribosomal protein L24
MPRHVRKGDMVMVTAGNDRGATGEVLRILVKHDRVVVQSVNIRAKHLKPTQANPQGGIVRREMPIHMSNVSPVVDGRPTRVRFSVGKDGVKSRVAAVGGKVLHDLHGSREKSSKKKAK